MKSNFALSLFLALTGCSSSYLIPTTRLMCSETEGQFKWSTEAGMHEIHRVYITDDIADTPVSESGHHMEPMITAGADGTFGVLDFLDVGVTYDIATAPLLFTKLQLLGESKRNSMPGDISFSVFAGAGYDSSFHDRSSSVDLFSSTPTAEGDVDRNGHGVYEVGGILGYRTSPKVILLAGGSVLWQNISGTQTLADGSGPYSFDDHSRFTEIHGGAMIHFAGNTKRGFFLTPMLQFGWVDTFGYRAYGTNVQANFGYQFK